MSESSFQFVHIRDGHNPKNVDSTTRKIIRQHGMRKSGNARRKPTRNPCFELAFRSSQPDRAGHPTPSAFEIDSTSAESNTATSEITSGDGSHSAAAAAAASKRDASLILLYRGDPGAGRKDPFTQYPVYMTERMHFLVQDSRCQSTRFDLAGNLILHSA